MVSARINPIVAKSLSRPAWLHVEGRLSTDALNDVLAALRRVLAIGDRIDLARNGAVARVRLLVPTTHSGLLREAREALAFEPNVTAVYLGDIMLREGADEWSRKPLAGYGAYPALAR